MFLRLAGVFAFVQMTLPLNKVAHPRLILCAKKHEWKRSVAANKAYFLQRMLRLKQGLKLKLLQGPNEDLWCNPRAALWCWRKSGRTWTTL